MMHYNNEQLENIYTLGEKFKIQQRKYEWFNFLKILNSKEKALNTLEIGAYDGGTTVTIAHFTDNLLTLDGNTPCRFNKKEIESICNFEYVSCDSLTLPIKEMVYSKFKTIDHLIIDGNHTFEGSYADYVNYRPLVKSGGIISFHDIVDSEYHRNANCYVSKTWQKVKELHKNTVELVYDLNGVRYDLNNITNRDVCWGGVGVILVD